MSVYLYAIGLNHIIIRRHFFSHLTTIAPPCSPGLSFSHSIASILDLGFLGLADSPQGSCEHQTYEHIDIYDRDARVDTHIVELCNGVPPYVGMLERHLTFSRQTQYLYILAPATSSHSSSLV